MFANQYYFGIAAYYCLFVTFTFCKFCVFTVSKQEQKLTETERLLDSLKTLVTNQQNIQRDFGIELNTSCENQAFYF